MKRLLFLAMAALLLVAWVNDSASNEPEKDGPVVDKTALEQDEVKEEPIEEKNNLKSVAEENAEEYPAIPGAMNASLVNINGEQQ